MWLETIHKYFCFSVLERYQISSRNTEFIHGAVTPQTSSGAGGWGMIINISSTKLNKEDAVLTPDCWVATVWEERNKLRRKSEKGQQRENTGMHHTFVCILGSLLENFLFSVSNQLLNLIWKDLPLLHYCIFWVFPRNLHENLFKNEDLLLLYMWILIIYVIFSW